MSFLSAHHVMTPYPPCHIQLTMSYPTHSKNHSHRVTTHPPSHIPLTVSYPTHPNHHTHRVTPHPPHLPQSPHSPNHTTPIVPHPCILMGRRQVGTPPTVPHTTHPTTFLHPCIPSYFTQHLNASRNIPSYFTQHLNAITLTINLIIKYFYYNIITITRISLYCNYYNYCFSAPVFIFLTSRLQPGDAGRYSCRVDFLNAQSTTRTAQVTAIKPVDSVIISDPMGHPVPPKISPIPEGGTLNLTCTARGGQQFANYSLFIIQISDM